MTDALELLLEGNAEHRYQQWKDGIRHYPEPIPGIALRSMDNSALPTMREATGHAMTEAKPRIRGRKLSKLANATPAIVRSDAEHTEHCRGSIAAIRNILAERAKLDSAINADRSMATRARLAHERLELQTQLRTVCMPLYGITFDDDDTATVYHVSANVLSDYKREGIKVTLVAFPVMRRYGRIASIRQSDANVAYCADYKDARGNNHAMGLAQTAWRIAHLEGDKDTAKVAYFWLYHGNLRVCRDIDCPCCTGKRRYKARELYLLAFRYLELELTDTRSRFYGSRFQHRMPEPTDAELNGWAVKPTRKS